MRILVTGSQGMVGSELVRLGPLRGHTIIAAAKADLDITKKESVRAYIEALTPEAIINAAAYNLVDAAETPEGAMLAHAINEDGPGNLAEAAHALNIPFIHMSTEYVFDGKQEEGYAEHDVPAPVESVYAKTKWRGEQAAMRACPTTYIARTSKIFGKKGDSPNVKESFVALMLRLAKEKPELNVVDAQEGCPTYAPHLAEALFSLLEGKYPYGVYHLVSDGVPVTPYAWAKEIFACAGMNPIVHPVAPDFFPSNAPRPLHGALLNTKFPPLPPRSEALKDFLNV